MLKFKLGSRKFCKCAFVSSFGLPQNGLACTMLMRLDLSSKFTSPTLMLGPVATLSVEGTENSRRVFSAIASKMSGASEMGSCAGTGHTLPLSSFQIKHKRRHKVTLAWKSKDYTLSTSSKLTSAQYLCSLALPGNGARNACWHFLAQSLGMVNP